MGETETAATARSGERGPSPVVVQVRPLSRVTCRPCRVPRKSVPLFGKSGDIASSAISVGPVRVQVVPPSVLTMTPCSVPANIVWSWSKCGLTASDRIHTPRFAAVVQLPRAPPRVDR